MFNKDGENNILLIILDAMAAVIDKVEDLPKVSPGLEDSELFKEIKRDVEELVAFMDAQADIMLDEYDKSLVEEESSVTDIFQTIPGGKNKLN